MESNNLVIAEKHYKKGNLRYNNKQYDKAILECQKYLFIVESVRKRYDFCTKDVYSLLGECYFQKHEYKNAIMAFRLNSRFLIYMHIPYLNTAELDLSLKKCGYTREEIDCYYSNLRKSTKHEKDGDNYRNNNDFTQAIEEYNKSIKIEEKSIGNDITIAFLQRKIACISALQENGNPMKQIDWEKLDYIDGVATNKESLGARFKYIKSGDDYHKKFHYDKALQQYQNVMDNVNKEHDEIKEKKIDMSVSSTDKTRYSCKQTEQHDKMNHGHYNTMKLIDEERKSLHQDIINRMNKKMEDMETNNRKRYENTINKVQEFKTSISKDMTCHKDEILENVTTKMEQIQNDTMKHVIETQQVMINNMNDTIVQMKNDIIGQMNNQKDEINDLKKSIHTILTCQRDMIKIFTTTDHCHYEAIENVEKKVEKIQSDHMKQAQDTKNQIEDLKTCMTKLSCSEYDNVCKKMTTSLEEIQKDNALYISNVQDKIMKNMNDSLCQVNNEMKDIQNLTKSINVIVKDNQRKIDCIVNRNIMEQIDIKVEKVHKDCMNQSNDITCKIHDLKVSVENQQDTILKRMNKKMDEYQMDTSTQVGELYDMMEVIHENICQMQHDVPIQDDVITFQYDMVKQMENHQHNTDNNNNNNNNTIDSNNNDDEIEDVEAKLKDDSQDCCLNSSFDKHTNDKHLNLETLKTDVVAYQEGELKNVHKEVNVGKEYDEIQKEETIEQKCLEYKTDIDEYSDIAADSEFSYTDIDDEFTPV